MTLNAGACYDSAPAEHVLLQDVSAPHAGTASAVLHSRPIVRRNSDAWIRLVSTSGAEETNLLPITKSACIAAFTRAFQGAKRGAATRLNDAWTTEG
jgi:hypothetical protein